jgi:hypothetical protein
MNGLLNLPSSVISISQVVESRVMKLIQSNCLEVELDGLLIIVFIAVRVADVIVAFHFLWIQIESLFVVFNGLIDFLEQVKCICQVVIDVSNFLVQFDSAFVILDCLFGFANVVESIGKTNYTLDLLWVVHQRLLEVLGSCLCMSRLEKKVAHCNHSWHVLRVKLQALLQEVSRSLKILAFKVNTTDLAESFEVCRVVINDKAVMFDSVICLVKLMQNLAKTEMSRHTHRIQLDAVSKILFSLVEVSGVCKLSSEMNACTEVALVVQQTLFKVIDRLFELLQFFELTANVEVSLKIALLFHIVGVVNKNLQTLLEGFKSFVVLVFLFKDAAKLNVCLSKLRVLGDYLRNEFVGVVDVFVIALVDL